MTQETKDNIQIGGFLIFMAIFLCFLGYLIGRNHQDYEIKESIVELDGNDAVCLDDSIDYDEKGMDDLFWRKSYYFDGEIQDCFCQQESREVVKETPYKKGDEIEVSYCIMRNDESRECFPANESEYHTEDGITTSTTTEEFSRCYIKEKIKK